LLFGPRSKPAEPAERTRPRLRLWASARQAGPSRP
jgi:hypothetical protein